MSLCVAYWAMFISKAGEKVKVRPGHAWEPAQQEHLIDAVGGAQRLAFARCPAVTPLSSRD